MYDGARWVNIPSDPARKPIVVWCNHGISDGKDDFVQRYRWDVDQGKWIPSDSTREGNTSIGPAGKREQNDGDWLLPGAPADRQHYAARCQFCPRHVPMREKGAQVALNRLHTLGLSDVPLAALRRAYNEVPRLLR